MKIVALLCNIGLLLFTGFVLLTEGAPKEAAYLVFTVWLLSTLIFSVVVISRSRASEGWPGTGAKEKLREGPKPGDGGSSAGTVMKFAAIVCNIVLLGFTCWALVDKYPHPREPGFIEFVVLMVLAPILNVLVLFQRGITRLSATPGSRPG